MLRLDKRKANAVTRFKVEVFTPINVRRARLVELTHSADVKRRWVFG